MNNIKLTFRNLVNAELNNQQILGRDVELRYLLQTLIKPNYHHAVIVGQPGIGKSSLIKLLAQVISDGIMPQLAGKIYQLNMAPILNLLASGESLHQCLIAIENNLSRQAKSIIVVEDIQLLATAEQSRLQQTIVLLQTIASLPNIKLITTTTPDAYQKLFSHDYTFNKLMVPIKLSKLNTETINIILNKAFQLQNISADNKTIATIIKLAERYNRGRVLPDIGLRLAEDVVARAIFSGHNTVSSTSVEEFIAEREQVPVTNLNAGSNLKLANLEAKLSSKIIGQRKAIKIISRTIIKSQLGLSNSNRPRSSFLLLGPSGVGKTETAKVLAEAIFNNQKAMTRLDMSEYSEAHSAIRLTGSPPGYIGYEEGGQLTGAVQRQPYSLILLDEIEKAHNKLFDVFLQVLDDGRLTDSSGVTADFTDTILIATSNIGSQRITDAVSDGVDVSSDKFMTNSLMPLLLKHFRPEFINRFDAILVYRPLSVSQLTTLAQKELLKLESRLSSRKINFEVSNNLLEDLIKSNYNPLFGARPVHRLIANSFEMPIAEAIVNGALDNETVIYGNESWLK